jgi:hypothetical protein
MIPSWANQTVTIIRPGVKIERGSEVPDWTNTWEKDVSGCSFQPAASTLSQDGRVLGVFDGDTCYMPPGTDVREGDRIEFDGNVYTINGTPRVWKSATGRASHVQVNLQRWCG